MYIPTLCILQCYYCTNFGTVTTEISTTSFSERGTSEQYLRSIRYPSQYLFTKMVMFPVLKQVTKDNSNKINDLSAAKTIGEPLSSAKLIQYMVQCHHQWDTLHHQQPFPLPPFIHTLFLPLSMWDHLTSDGQHSGTSMSYVSNVCPWCLHLL